MNAKSGKECERVFLPQKAAMRLEASGFLRLHHLSDHLFHREGHREKGLRKGLPLRFLEPGSGGPFLDAAIISPSLPLKSARNVQQKCIDKADQYG